MRPIRVCVITVCYNAASDLPVTIESVLAQDRPPYMYIIKDGGSTDDTGSVVDGYRKRFEDKGIRFIYVSEKDRGIYDAMNIAASSADGDYVSFMNAGDCFYNDHVLSDVFDSISDNDGKVIPDIVYGDCVVYEYGRFFLFPKSVQKIQTSMPFSHQSCFAGIDRIKEHPFDIAYRMCADYDFLLTLHDEGRIFYDSKKVICITTADGVSSVNYRDTRLETARIQKDHGLNVKTKENELLVKQFVMDHFPRFVRKMIRSYQIKKRGQQFEAVIPGWFKSAML